MSIIEDMLVVHSFTKREREREKEGVVERHGAACIQGQIDRLRERGIADERHQLGK